MPRTVFLLCAFLASTSLAGAEGAWSWLSAELRVLDSRHEVIESRLAALLPEPGPQVHERAGFHSGFASTVAAVRWVQADLGAEMELDAVVLVPAVLGGAEAYGFPKRFRVDASRDARFAESVTLLDHTHADAPSGLAPWHLPAGSVRARFVRFTATKLATQPGLESRPMFALGELLAFCGGRNVALGCPVEAAGAVETLPTWSPRHLVDGTHALGLPVNPRGERRNGWHSAVSSRPDALKWVQVDLGEEHPVDEIRLIPAHPGDYPDRSGFGFPRRFRVEADDRMILDRTAADVANPGDSPVALPTPGLRARTIRVTATSLWERSADFVFALAEVQVCHAGENIALGGLVTSLDETETAQWRAEHLVDGLTSAGSLMPEVAWLAALSERRELTAELGRLSAARDEAEAEARRRAGWLAGGLLLGSIVAAWLWLLALRRERHRELQALRQRISRDLHDDIGSQLGSIRLLSELALRDGSAPESLEEIHRLAREAAESMRGIVWLVREGEEPEISRLAEALRHSAADLFRGLDWHLETSPDRPGVTKASLDFHRQVWLMFREMAHNVTRHAGARSVRVLVSWQDGRFRLSVADDGCGFDPESSPEGHGLGNLRHRAESLRGSLQITTAPGKGTRIALDVPIS